MTERICILQANPNVMVDPRFRIQQLNGIEANRTIPSTTMQTRNRGRAQSQGNNANDDANSGTVVDDHGRRTQHRRSTGTTSRNHASNLNNSAAAAANTNDETVASNDIRTHKKASIDVIALRQYQLRPVIALPRLVNKREIFKGLV